MKKLALALPVLALGCGGGGGSAVDGGSDANGPRYDGPMVREVAVNVITSGIRRSALAFGGDGPVTRAVASENVIGILLNLPLLASGLIEIPCADGSFDRIPAGATAEDIARCSPPDLADCSAVCQGPPVVGILDVNGDGEPDGSRLLDYGGGEAGVRIQCDGVNIRINRFFENYNPNGPRQLGVLGPMLSLDVPTLRTSSECAITFRDEVTGIDGARVCAPEGGDITLDCAVPGAPIAFGTEPLRLIDSDPVEGETVVVLTDPVLNSR